MPLIMAWVLPLGSLVISIAETKKFPGASNSGSTKVGQSSWALIRSGNKKEVETKAPPKALLAVRGRSGRAKGKGKKGAPNLPPMLNTVITVSHTFRYYVASAITTATIQAAFVAGACGGTVSIVNSAFKAWASTVKIRKISIWPALSSTEHTPEVEWLTPLGPIEKDVAKNRALPGGVTIDRVLVSRPPRGTLCADWINILTSPSANLFALLDVPAQSVIDFDVSFTLSNVLASDSLTIASGTLGGIYYLALDGAGTNKIVPVGVPTTA